MKHQPQHEPLLLECLTRPDPLGTLQGSAAAGCETCKESIEEYMEVQEQLDAVGHDLSASAVATGKIAGEHVVGEHLVEEILGRRLALRTRSRWLAFAAAGSAAAALLLCVWIFVRRSAPEPGPSLGTIGLELLIPQTGSAPGTGYGTFTWRARLPADGWFEIRVLARDGRELALATTEEERWTPASTADWPSEIRWQVSAYDASGALLEAREASASRSSP